MLQIFASRMSSRSWLQVLAETSCCSKPMVFAPRSSRPAVEEQPALRRRGLVHAERAHAELPPCRVEQRVFASST